MIRLLLCPNTEISPNITFSDSCSCHEMIWETGHIIEKGEHDLNKLEFICEDLPAGHFPDFAISDLGCPIVSNRLKDHLNQHGIDNIEYFPATVIEKIGGSPIGGYFAANILGLIDCIDFDESTIECDEEDGEIIGIDYIDELVLKDQESGYGLIYRLHLFRRTIVIEEPLVTALTEAGMEGIKLIEPGKWDGFYGEK